MGRYLSAGDSADDLARRHKGDAAEITKEITERDAADALARQYQFAIDQASLAAIYPRHSTPPSDASMGNIPHGTAKPSSAQTQQFATERFSPSKVVANAPEDVIRLQEVQGSWETDQASFEELTAWKCFHNFHEDPETGSCITLVKNSSVVVGASYTTILVIGRAQRTTIKGPQHLFTTWNIHNFGINHAQFMEICSLTCKDNVSSSNTPPRSTNFVTIDWNFVPSDVPQLSHPLHPQVLTHLQRTHETVKVGQASLPETLDGMCELRHNHPPHSQGRQTFETPPRLDQAFTTAPGWKIIHLCGKFGLPPTQLPTTRHRSSYTDHSPLLISHTHTLLPRISAEAFITDKPSPTLAPQSDLPAPPDAHREEDPWNRSTELGIPRESAPSNVTLISVQLQLKAWLDDANYEDTHHITGNSTSRNFTIHFKCFDELAARRARDAFLSLRRIGGPWRNFHDTSHDGSTVRLLIDVDKNDKQVAEENALKRLASACKKAHPHLHFNCNERDLKVTTDCIPIAKVHLMIVEKEKVTWNTEALDCFQIKKSCRS